FRRISATVVTLSAMPSTRARLIPATVVATPTLSSIAPASHSFIAAVSIFASLLAAGSCGLIGHPLRHAMTLLALLAVTASALPHCRALPRRLAALLLFALLGAYLSASASMIVSALGVLVLLG